MTNSPALVGIVEVRFPDWARNEIKRYLNRRDMTVTTFYDSTGAPVAGKSLETVARRLYGRKATVTPTRLKRAILGGRTGRSVTIGRVYRVSTPGKYNAGEVINRL